MPTKKNIFSNGMVSQAFNILVKNSYTFKKTYDLLKKSQYWSADQLEEYQLEQLNKLIIHAYENVPYYTNIFDENGLKPSDIQDFKDLDKLPFLTKEIVQENINLLKSKKYSADSFEYVTTGGSTGIPMGFYLENGVSKAKEWAFIKTQWDRVGYHFRDKCVYLRGAVINNSNQGQFWEYAMLNRWLVMSSYHMTDENVPLYIEKIKKFKPKFFQAYPSTITILARYMQENNISAFPTVKAILCGSENLYPSQRQLLEEVFGCRVYSWYGHAEQAVLGGECEHSSNYHLFPEYGYTELIDEYGNNVSVEGGMGEIVVTGFNNPIFPFIRYRTMDIGVLTKEKCKCGRNYPLLKKIEGRLQELIITKENRLISMTSINMHSDVFDNVKQFQFIQEKKGEIFLNIVKKRSYTENDTNNIKLELNEKLGDDIDLTIKFVDEIPRTKNGKYRFLIQKMNIAE